MKEAASKTLRVRGSNCNQCRKIITNEKYYYWRYRRSWEFTRINIILKRLAMFNIEQQRLVYLKAFFAIIPMQEDWINRLWEVLKSNSPFTYLPFASISLIIMFAVNDVLYYRQSRVLNLFLFYCFRSQIIWQYYRRNLHRKSCVFWRPRYTNCIMFIRFTAEIDK